MIPEVSIITALFNKRKYIRATIESVISQTHSRWELLIIDDCSDDGSFEVASEFSAKNSKICVHRNDKRRGGNFSRNKGLKLAKAPLVVFLDADDLLADFCVEQRVKYMRQYDHINFAVFPIFVFQQDIVRVKRIWKPFSKFALSNFLAHNLPWQTMQPIWRKDFLATLNGFDEEMLRLQDVDLHTRALLTDDKNFLVSSGAMPDAYYRIDEDRKNYEAANFVEKWIIAAVMYYEKFMPVATERGLQKRLNGTLYHAFLQLVWLKKKRAISAEKYDQLCSFLFKGRGLSPHATYIFKLSEYYHRLPVRIPGVNKLFNIILTNIG